MIVQVYSAKISRSVARVVLRVAALTVPNRRISLDLSTVRICSSRIKPAFPWKRTGIRDGADRLPVVIGAAVTMGKRSFISGGDTTKHGRVFWISLPIVGSSAASQTSPRTTRKPTAERLCLTT